MTDIILYALGGFLGFAAVFWVFAAWVWIENEREFMAEHDKNHWD